MLGAVDYLVVGDVQGCDAELGDLLAAADFRPDAHRLALVGDLINRGPSSRAVLDRAIALGAEVVLGNHEDALLRGRQSETLDLVRAQLGPGRPRYEAWMRALPLFRRYPGWILVHAGIAPGKRPEECSTKELTRIREVAGRPWFDSWRGPETVIFGHWSVRGRVDLPLAKGLDTGCVYGGRLTGLWWPRGEWVSVPARRIWYDPRAGRPTWV
jgi:hypothetical protein